MGDYRAEHYNSVFAAMKERFGTTWHDSIPPYQWNIWRRQIKEHFFDEGILITEMVAGLEEAAGKLKWPVGKSFFARLHDVVLKNRRESWTVRTDGMASLGDLLAKRT